MKKILAIVLSLILLLGAWALPAASADTYATATVKGGWLRLRAQPNDDAETISAYFTGTTVSILGGSGVWYYVLTPDGKTGYMHSGYLTITGSITGGQVDENTAGIVVSSNGQSVRLRSGPSTDYSIIASYPVGTPLTILSSGDTWCRVRIAGRTGYMMSEFVAADDYGSGDPGASVNPGSGYTAYVTADNGLPCVMRSGPSKQYEIIATYNVGTQITVTSYGATWSAITVGGMSGYMMSQFISTTRPDVPIYPDESGTVAYVTSANGLGVRMRTGAGKIYPAIATYSVGTRVTVLERGATWSRIRIEEQVGYMMTEFLTSTAPSPVLSVRIDKSTAWPGQTITAQVSPSGASASIAWMNDRGQTLAYGETYTVQLTDTGRKIRASVTGIGGTNGSDVSGWCSVQGGGYVESVYRITGVTISDDTPEAGQTLTATVKPGGASAYISWYWADGTYIGSGETYTVRSVDMGRRIYVHAQGRNTTTGEATSGVTYAVTAGESAAIALQSVTIDDTTPNVGQTLSLTLYPDNATASYTWRCSDGRILGYGDTYLVTEAENGKSIYVYANGTGNTTGSAVSSLTSAVTSAATSTVRIDGVILSDLTPVVGQTLVAVVNPSYAQASLMWLRDDDVILGYGSSYVVRAADEGHVIYVWAEGINGTFGSANSDFTEPVTR